MFSGIIETTGTVKKAVLRDGNLELTVGAPFSGSLKKGQSVAHDGVCLTVTAAGKNGHTVEAVRETLGRTNLGLLKKGDAVNLERSVKAGGRLDGHIVQGHVDDTARCTSVTEVRGSRLFAFRCAKPHGGLIIEKGSVCVSGVSLTVVSCNKTGFSVAVIPHTLRNTNFRSLNAGDTVNLEYDIIGKYVRSLLPER